jgi:hypothetical protein
MSMRKQTRRELRKLRELVHVLLAGRTCPFCGGAVAQPRDGWQGSADGPVLTERLTVHHRDGDHGNNLPGNHEVCHRRCHKAHHGRRRKRECDPDLGPVIEGDICRCAKCGSADIDLAAGVYVCRNCGWGE